MGDEGKTRKEVHVSRIKKYADSDLRVSAELRLSAEYDQVACVSSIVAHRVETQEFQLKVRWQGFEEADDTWEPIAQLLEDVPEIVRKYAETTSDAALIEFVSASTNK